MRTRKLAMAASARRRFHGPRALLRLRSGGDARVTEAREHVPTDGKAPDPSFATAFAGYRVIRECQMTANGLAARWPERPSAREATLSPASRRTSPMKRGSAAFVEARPRENAYASTSRPTFPTRTRTAGSAFTQRSHRSPAFASATERRTRSEILAANTNPASTA